MIVIANLFPRLLTLKDLVTPLSNKRYFRTSFGSEHVKVSQTLVRSAWVHFYHTFWSLCRKMIWEISPLSKFEILAVFLNTWTADDKYPVQDCENLQFPIQIQLSWKLKNFSEISVAFMKYSRNFKHFQKKKWSW